MEEETLKQYMNEYYRGFTADYEIAHLDNDILFPPGDIKIGVRDARTTSKSNISKKILMDIAVFTMKMGGENVKRILETILLEKSCKDTATTKDATGENTTEKEIDRELISNFVKEYMFSFYKNFFEFEKQHVDDFVTAIKNKEQVNLVNYETEHLDEDLLIRRERTPQGVRDKEKKMGVDVIKDNLMDIAAFTIKKGAAITTKILISLGYDHFKNLQRKDAAVEELRKTKDELNSLLAKHKEDKEKIDDLEKEKKIADE
ncbi:hypothetical protein RhiirA1_476179 [Rhizophagus irregularis]|uniref:Uncharacterized protein n=1 Tax=Rhizophagus irregularis TaxID=588596 RepID=A0A2N0QVK5_9GLOM|nr:hypothetical protein RhiirA1_476179 [Rhizophagus irregularis]CAB4492780.1 unnamed protein product [Rhizophagus irregularis]